MGFRELEKEFKQAVPVESQNGSDLPTRVYQYWLLRLLFEIAGNLDSLVVSYRELVKLQKSKMDQSAKLK